MKTRTRDDCRNLGKVLQILLNDEQCRRWKLPPNMHDWKVPMTHALQSFPERELKDVLAYLNEYSAVLPEVPTEQEWVRAVVVAREVE